LVTVLCRLHAQTAPCGIAIVHSQGEKIDERFIPAPPEQVKTALLKAFPSVGVDKVKKDDGFHINAENPAYGPLRVSIMETNFAAGLHDSIRGLPFGKFFIDIREATQDGVSGSLLHIKFEKPTLLGAAVNHGYIAKPLAEETVCMTKLLSYNDPAVNPRGLALENTGTPRSVVLPEGTPLKVMVRDAVWSSQLKNGGMGKTMQFEVAEDLVVDGATLVRRGALATGHFTDVKEAKGYGRNAELGFVFDTATAVDGQNIPISDEGEKVKGGRTDQTSAIVLILPTLGWLVKGTDAFVPAGTIYEVAVSGQHTVQTGH
jgi:hypothetical protein